ncbi:MAG: DUF1385 domain-containing protein [Chloroflexota bacterium]
MKDSPQFHYGGQALIEGVMIRGEKHVSIAVRRPRGDVHLLCQPLGRISVGRWGRAPLARGVVVLGETLALGMKALLYSAEVALEEGEEKAELPKGLAWGTVALSLGLGVGLFFLLPYFLAGLVKPALGSPILFNLVEGLLRLAILIGYLKVVGLFGDIRRVFAYHGAEHRVVNAYEAGVPLEIEQVKNYPTAHTRCGTGFLLVVVVISVLAFSLLGRPPLWLGVLGRLVLLPAIAAVSYELIRLGARHHSNPVVRALLWPGLRLQGLTTRPPDEGMVEVAIKALQGALEADGATQAGSPAG